MSERDDATAAERFAAELDSVETSPAQPDDAHRIDETNDGDAAPGPAHIKHEHPGKMEH